MLKPFTFGILSRRTSGSPQAELKYLPNNLPAFGTRLMSSVGGVTSLVRVVEDDSAQDRHEEAALKASLPRRGAGRGTSPIDMHSRSTCWRHSLLQP